MPDTTTPETIWHVSHRVMQLPDGSFLIKTGKPILRANAGATSRLCGISLKNLRILAEAGFIRCARPTPHTTLYYPEEIMNFIARTEADLAFWNKVRRAPTS